MKEMMIEPVLDLSELGVLMIKEVAVKVSQKLRVSNEKENKHIKVLKIEIIFDIGSHIYVGYIRWVYTTIIVVILTTILVSG